MDANLSTRLLAQCADAAIYADRDGIIRMWNTAAVKMFGFSSEEAIGQSLDIIVPERLRAPHWVGYRLAMDKGRGKHAGQPTRTKALTRAGETIFVTMSFSVITDEAGPALGSLAIARLSAP